MGGTLGALAGLVGLGGGVFLGPALVLLGWADGKRAAAASSGFILLNSLAGLVAHVQVRHLPEGQVLLPLVAAVLIGGQAGSLAGARGFSARRLEQIFGVLVLAVAGQLAYRAAA